MKRNLIVFVLLVSLVLTACVVTVPVQTQDNNQVVIVEVESPAQPCDTCAAIPATEPTLAPTFVPTPAVTAIVDEPTQLKDMGDSIRYPIQFKGMLGDEYVCGAKEVNVSYPEGFSAIEEWKKSSEDGNYLHGSGEYSMAAFCAGTNPEDHLGPAGAEWRLILITTEGIEDVEFPLE